MERLIYCFWTGINEMSFQRRRCFESMRASCAKIVLITPQNLPDYIKPGFPLHPAYEYLSLTHKSDYLRCYFMHHYGGGYSDIKEITKSWNSAFEDMNAKDVFINGYQEIGPKGVAKIKGPLYQELVSNYRALIGLGALICKPGSPFTNDWINELHNRLDMLYEELKAHPAIHPQEYPGMILNESKGKYVLILTNIFNKLFHKNIGQSRYPVSWSGILGDIFHPLCLKYRNNIEQTVPKPNFHGYR